MNSAVRKILWWSVIYRILWLEQLIYRYYCPRPIDHNVTARACCAAGNCGCNNTLRYPTPTKEREG